MSFRSSVDSLLGELVSEMTESGTVDAAAIMAAQQIAVADIPLPPSRVDCASQLIGVSSQALSEGVISSGSTSTSAAQEQQSPSIALLSGSSTIVSDADKVEDALRPPLHPPISSSVEPMLRALSSTPGGGVRPTFRLRLPIFPPQRMACPTPYGSRLLHPGGSIETSSATATSPSSSVESSPVSEHGSTHADQSSSRGVLVVGAAFTTPESPTALDALQAYSESDESDHQPEVIGDEITAEVQLLLDELLESTGETPVTPRNLTTLSSLSPQQSRAAIETVLEEDDCELLTPTEAPSASATATIAIETRPIMSAKIQAPYPFYHAPPPRGFKKCAIILERVPSSPTAQAEFVRRALAEVSKDGGAKRAKTERRVRFGGKDTVGAAKKVSKMSHATTTDIVVDLTDDDIFDGGGASTDGGATVMGKSNARPSTVASTLSNEDDDEELPPPKSVLVKASKQKSLNSSTKAASSRESSTKAASSRESTTKAASSRESTSKKKAGKQGVKDVQHAKSSHAESSRQRPPKRGRRITSEDEEELVAESVVHPPKAKRKCSQKGKVGRPLFDFLMANPKQLFRDADSELLNDPSHKASPEVRVPPMAESDRERAPLSTKKLTQRVRAFISGENDVALDFSTMQHQERLDALRLLLPTVFAGDYNVEPLVRLLRQNCTAPTDPLVGIVTALKPELIDSRRSSHSTSAHFILFYYALPLLLQRWGIMSVGTPSTNQWGAIGQHYTNWSKVHRWPELFIVAPVETTALIRSLLQNRSCGMSAEFQCRLGVEFAKQSALVSRWWHIRRQAHAVRRDETGRSLEANIIAAQTANWLDPLSPTDVRKGIILGEDIPLSTQVHYEDAQVYSDAITVLAGLLAHAKPELAHVQLVDRMLLAEHTRSTAGSWIGCNDDDATITSAVETLQKRSLQEVEVTLDTSATIPDLVLACQTEKETGGSGQLHLRIPLINWAALFDQLHSQKSHVVVSATSISTSTQTTDDEPALTEDAI